MALIIPITLILTPIIEIAVFIALGGEIGIWNTIGLIVITAIIGASLLRNQGLTTLRRAQDSLNRQIFPVTELFDGICLLVAGILLLTPGFVTDSIGFLLFMPPVRRVLRAWLWATLNGTEDAGIWKKSETANFSQNASNSNDTIDGRFREVKSDKGTPSIDGNTNDDK